MQLALSLGNPLVQLAQQAQKKTLEMTSHHRPGTPACTFDHTFCLNLSVPFRTRSEHVLVSLDILLDLVCRLVLSVSLNLSVPFRTRSEHVLVSLDISLDLVCCLALSVSLNLSVTFRTRSAMIYVTRLAACNGITKEQNCALSGSSVATGRALPGVAQEWSLV
ncbi:hypothetical protein RRG08_017745 [Elysia crispata]|uniref:Uncharacterized protein n=1 Tax=Elysia crispata TaxID=231223 RepID=A0AAE0XR02_9GAST|nr:hypothetical protein RRG08_017745 [Elysia crispata]